MRFLPRPPQTIFTHRNINFNLLIKFMDKKIGLFWLRDDFRISKNNGLIEATYNHDQVVIFYLYKKKKYQYQEAQKWWLSKSLYNFQKNLDNFNINLEILEVDSYKFFF